MMKRTAAAFLAAFMVVTQAWAGALFVTAQSPERPSAGLAFLSALDARVGNARTGTAWDFDCSGTGAIVAFPGTVRNVCPGNGTFNAGIGIFPAGSNYLFPSTSNVTQTVSLPLKGSYVASVVGSGSMTLSGGAACTVTASAPCLFTTPAAGTSVTFTASGTLSYRAVSFISALTLSQAAPLPPIVTTSAAVARSADVVTADVAKIGLGVNAGSIVASIYIPAWTNTNQSVLSISDGSGAANGFHVYVRSTVDHKLQSACEAGGTVQFSALGVLALTAGAVHTIGMSYGPTGTTIVADGLAFTDTSGACSATLSKLILGANGANTFQLGGYIQSIQVYGSRLSDAYLQALTATPSPALSGPVHLIIDDGQSLATGRCRQAPCVVNGAPLNAARILMPNDLYGAGGTRLNYPYLSGGNPGISGVVAAFEAQSVNPPTNPTDFGETGIVSEAAERIAEGSTSTFIVRGVAAGAQTIAQLQPGSNSYKNYASLVSTLAALSKKNAGPGNVFVDSISWDQGESDRLNPPTDPATYTSLENTLINKAVADAVAATGQATPPLWVEAQLAASGIANGTGSPLSLAQRAIAVGANANPYARECVSKYIFLSNPFDGLHLPVLEYVRKAEYLAKCVQRELSGGTKWLPLTPTAAVFETGYGALDMTWTVPVPPIRFDTADPIQGPAYNHGLEFVDDCITAGYGQNQNAAPYTNIAGVTITDATHIRVTLSAPYSTACTNPAIQVAYNGPAVASQTVLPTVRQGGSGGTSTNGTPNGPCVFAISFDTALSQGQAQYSGTLTNGVLTSVDSPVYRGLYPPQDIATQTIVPVVGCGLAGANLNNVILRRGDTSLVYSGAWSDIADSDTTVSRSGNKLIDWADVSSTPVTLN